MFQIGNHVLCKDNGEEVGTVVSVFSDPTCPQETLYGVEFASGRRTLHSYDLRPSPPANSCCREREQLSQAFQEAFKIYYRAVSELGKAAGLVARTEYDFLLRRAKTAQEVCLVARERVHQHTAQHGC